MMFPCFTTELLTMTPHVRHQIVYITKLTGPWALFGDTEVTTEVLEFLQKRVVVRGALYARALSSLTCHEYQQL